MSPINKRRVFLKRLGALACAIPSGSTFADMVSCKGTFPSKATFIQKRSNGPLGRYLDKYFGSYTDSHFSTDLFEIHGSGSIENCAAKSVAISLTQKAWRQFAILRIEVVLQQVFLSADTFIDKNYHEWPYRKVETVGEISHVATYTFGDDIVPSFEFRHRPVYDFFRIVLLANVYSYERNASELHYSESTIFKLL